jgi:hypothetical protein
VCDPLPRLLGCVCRAAFTHRHPRSQRTSLGSSRSQAAAAAAESATPPWGQQHTSGEGRCGWGGASCASHGHGGLERTPRVCRLSATYLIGHSPVSCAVRCAVRCAASCAVSCAVSCTASCAVSCAASCAVSCAVSWCAVCPLRACAVS